MTTDTHAKEGDPWPRTSHGSCRKAERAGNHAPLLTRPSEPEAWKQHPEVTEPLSWVQIPTTNSSL